MRRLDLVDLLGRSSSTAEVTSTSRIRSASAAISCVGDLDVVQQRQAAVVDQHQQRVARQRLGIGAAAATSDPLLGVVRQLRVEAARSRPAVLGQRLGEARPGRGRPRPACRPRQRPRRSASRRPARRDRSARPSALRASSGRERRQVDVGQRRRRSAASARPRPARLRTTFSVAATVRSASCVLIACSDRAPLGCDLGRARSSWRAFSASSSASRGAPLLVARPCGRPRRSASASLRDSASAARYSASAVWASSRADSAASRSAAIALTALVERGLDRAEGELLQQDTRTIRNVSDRPEHQPEVEVDQARLCGFQEQHLLRAPR